MACAATSFTLKEMFPSIDYGIFVLVSLTIQNHIATGSAQDIQVTITYISITITTRIRPTVLGRRAVGVAGGCPWKEFPTRPSGV